MRSAFIAAVVVTLSAGFATAQPVSTSGEPSITVQGQGRVEVPPDHAVLAVDVVTKGKSADAATASHRERATRAVNALREMKKDGLEIERSAFRLNEIRTPPGPTPRQGREETEYRAVTTFELKITPVGGVDAAVTALAATGLFEVRNLHFGIDQKNPAIREARKDAVEDARQRATTYAQAAGVELGDIVRIQDTSTPGPQAFLMSAPAARSVQVIPPGALTLSATVTITWRIGRKP